MKHALILLVFITSVFAKDSHNYPLSLSVIKVRQVPFSTQMGGNSYSSNCRITGSTINELDLSCDTTQNQGASVPGVAYYMLATGSDGKTYMFGCSAQWRWSNCSGLMTGSYSARIDSGKLAISALTSKGKEKEIRFDILSMESTPNVQP